MNWLLPYVDWAISPSIPNYLPYSSKAIDASLGQLYPVNSGYDPGGTAYPNARLIFNGLPDSNDDFGTHNLSEQVNGGNSQGAYFQTFFPRDESNYPGAVSFGGLVNSGKPNWYYYWSQTKAFYGTVEYTPGDRSYCGLDGATGQWIAHICDDAPLSAASGTWNNAEGIDYFANVCRHEDQHRQDLTAFWGSSYDASQDQDGDLIPDVLEPTILPGRPYDPTLRATYPDEFDYGEDPLPDIEDYALSREPAWVNHSDDAEDWTAPGHQYKH